MRFKQAEHAAVDRQPPLFHLSQSVRSRHDNLVEYELLPRRHLVLQLPPELDSGRSVSCIVPNADILR